MLHKSSPSIPSAALTKYLQKRKGSQNWQLRLMVPRRARIVIGKREFTESLKTPDRREAERLAFEILARWNAQIAAIDAVAPALIDAPTVPSAIDIEEAALVVGYEEAARRTQALIRTKAQSGAAAFAALEAEFTRRHSDALRRLHAGEHGYWRERARRYVAKAGWTLPEESDEFAAFTESLARCGTDLFARARAMIAGRDETFTPSAFVQDASRKRMERAADGEDIMSLYAIYAAERLAGGLKRNDTLNQDRKVLDGFAEFVGRNRGLRSITADDVREWRNAVAKAPAGFSKRTEYQGLSIRQAAKRAEAVGDKGINLVTVNRYLSAISALFKWAKRDGYIDRNVCDGLFYEVDKSKNRRPPFDDVTLNKLLKSPLFNGFLADGKENSKGDFHTRDWRFWLPLICLFTGARIGEAAQLRTGDVSEIDGYWMINIANDSKGGLTTKNGKSRLVPIHSTLRAIGFVKYAKEQQARAEIDGDTRLFTNIERNERGQYGQASRFWRTYLKRIGIKEGGDGFGSHSFRHGLADQLRLAGYLDNEVGIVLGHSQPTVTGGYGALRQGTAEKLSSIIEGAKFEGVNFNHLFVE